jgi:hypothetical protein
VLPGRPADCGRCVNGRFGTLKVDCCNKQGFHFFYLHFHGRISNCDFFCSVIRFIITTICEFLSSTSAFTGLLRQLRHPTMVNAPGFFFDYDTVEIDNEDSTVTADAQIDNADERDFFDDDDQGELGCYRGNRIVDAPSVDKDNHATEGADQESAIARDQLNESDVLFTSPREKQHHQDDIREHEEDERPNQEAASVSEGSHCYPLQYHRHQHRRKSMRDPSCGFERLVATPLVAAVCNGQLRIVQRLLELPHLEVDQVSLADGKDDDAYCAFKNLVHIHARNPYQSLLISVHYSNTKFLNMIASRVLHHVCDFFLTSSFSFYISAEP